MQLAKAEQLALGLFSEHGLVGWKFQFGQSVRKFGLCDPLNQRIIISAPLVELNDEARVKNTLLHEIAHALTIGHGHDRTWRSTAITIGCDGRRCYDHTKVIRPARPYIGTCGCRSIEAFRRTKIYCTKCMQPFKWTLNKNLF